MKINKNIKTKEIGKEINPYNLITKLDFDINMILLQHLLYINEIPLIYYDVLPNMIIIYTNKKINLDQINKWIKKMRYDDYLGYYNAMKEFYLNTKNQQDIIVFKVISNPSQKINDILEPNKLAYDSFNETMRKLKIRTGKSFFSSNKKYEISLSKEINIYVKIGLIKEKFFKNVFVYFLPSKIYYQLKNYEYSFVFSRNNAEFVDVTILDYTNMMIIKTNLNEVNTNFVVDDKDYEKSTNFVIASGLGTINKRSYVYGNVHNSLEFKENVKILKNIINNPDIKIHF